MRWTKTPVAAVAILLTALPGSAYAQPAPSLPILDVPFISQSEALCGGAAAAMVLRYWGERGLTAESFAHLVDRSAAGIRTDALVEELRRRGWTATAVDGTDAEVDAQLRRGRPVITLIQDRASTFHYVVVVGATPDAIIFHDPARAPLRVVSRTEFTRRWQAAKRWMALVVPGERASNPEPAASIPSAKPQGSCDELIAAGVQRAQGNDLAGAERDLTMALSCGGAAALRELAGVRALQKRWVDVEALGSAATSIDPQDPYGWRLLGTSRFVQNDPVGALRAWNRIGEPRLDLVRIGGLERTRQRVVERLIDAKPDSLVTPHFLVRSDRRLRALPAAESAAAEVVPVPGGLAELSATVNERPVLPSDRWSYVGLAAVAAAQRKVGLAIGSLTGGGERTQVDWRFWPGRPRFEVSLDAPAAWGGVWGVHGFFERERFTDPQLTASRRSGTSLQWSMWVSAITQVDVDVAIEHWDDLGAIARAGLGVRLLSAGSRISVRAGTETWRGASAFSRADVTITAVSSTRRSGRVYVGRSGFAVGSAQLPPMLWFGGDTGHTRPTLLRAHPLVADASLRTEQLGRTLLHASAEAQQWWSAGVLNMGAAMFVDAARTGRRLDPLPRHDVDVGVGLRLALPAMPGTFRVDAARGVRDAVTRWSFVYETGG